MPLFSQRHGHTPIQKAMQRDSLDAETRNQLWSVLSQEIWSGWDNSSTASYYPTPNRWIAPLVEAVWTRYFKLPADSMGQFFPGSESKCFLKIRDHFLGGKWYEVFNFLEFVLAQISEELSEELAVEIATPSNKILENENSAYRISNLQFVPITDEAELAAIDEATAAATPETRKHLQAAIRMLTARPTGDYRNSVKESISAVEAACQQATGDPKATLGQALKKLENAGSMHPAFKSGLSSLYGYTSDAGGIRHALTADDSQAPSFEDAKLMLVLAAGFVNYLAAREAAATHRTKNLNG